VSLPLYISRGVPGSSCVNGLCAAVMDTHMTHDSSRARTVMGMDSLTAMHGHAHSTCTWHGSHEHSWTAWQAIQAGCSAVIRLESVCGCHICVASRLAVSLLNDSFVASVMSVCQARYVRYAVFGRQQVGRTGSTATGFPLCPCNAELWYSITCVAILQRGGCVTGFPL
jgi:hypothetical protein